MMSTVAVVGICVAVSVGFLLAGSVFSVWFLRLRDRKETRLTSSLGRGLSTYNRARLSGDVTHYSHIPPPRAALRRSNHLLYGAAAEGWREVPSQESIGPQQMASTDEQPEIDETVPAPKRRKSFRQTLYGNFLNVPKTRRQKKIEKAIAQSSMPLSPLSAITEFTDASEVNTPTVVELPTSITPRQTPEKIDSGRPWGRPLSIQWPLPIAIRRSEDTPPAVVTSIPARDSILIRKSSMGTIVHGERPNFGRSVSMASVVSDIPESLPPPLPLRRIQRFSQQNDDASRRSTASLDTISSSVLGSGQNSPSRTVIYNSTTPTLDLRSPGLHQFSPARARGNPSAITVGMAAGKRAQQGIVSGSGTHSFRASIGEHAALRNVSNSRSNDRSDQRFKNSHLFDDSLKIIDASSWKPVVPRPVSHRSTLSPSLPAPVGRKPHGSIGTSARHSMFESQMLTGKRASDPMEHASAAEILTGSPRQLAPPRPTSLASGNPYQWDLRPLPSLSVSPLPLKKGHKRQNCVRISNLPAIDTKRNSKLPEMMEEEEEEEEKNGKPRIPGLKLLEVENGTPALRARTSLLETRALPSPFHNQPILEPTSKRRLSYRRQSSSDLRGAPDPHSDIFTNSLSDPVTPTIFDGNNSGSRTMWPLSPTPRNNIKLNSTPPKLSVIHEPYEPHGPVSPSPALTSATILPRMSAVPQGPRNAAVSARSSRNASPSPLNGSICQNPKENELRRSVMMLRRGTSESKFLDRATRLYRNMGEQSVSNFSLPNASQSNLGLASKSTYRTSANLNISDKRRESNMALSKSRSTMSMAISPSMISISGISVWDDASVCDDADLDMRNSMMHISGQKTLGDHDPEAYENFVGQERQYVGRTPSDPEDMERERALTSPHGKGLGIINLGTPGSLYDRDGFLKN